MPVEYINLHPILECTDGTLLAGADVDLDAVAALGRDMSAKKATITITIRDLNMVTAEQMYVGLKRYAELHVFDMPTAAELAEGVTK